MSAIGPLKGAALAGGGMLALILLLGMCSPSNGAGESERAPQTPEETETAPEAPAAMKPTHVSLGRCNMGTCSWSQILEREPIQRSKAGVLLRLRLLGGTSDHEDEEYPARPNEANIVWNAKPHEVWVFCSPVLPVTMMRVDDGYQVDVLTFKTVEGIGIPGALESSASLYMDACYADFPAHGVLPPDLNHYRPLPMDLEIEVRRPEDIIQQAEQRLASTKEEATEQSAR